MVRGESIADNGRRIAHRRGDNVRVVILEVKNMGCGGLVALVVNPEIDSLAPPFERGVRVPLLNLSKHQSRATCSKCACRRVAARLGQGVGKECRPVVVRSFIEATLEHSYSTTPRNGN